MVKAKAAAFSAEYNNNNSQFSAKYFNSMAGIPDTYLDWMSTRAASDNFRIYTARSTTLSSFTKWGGRDDKISVDRSAWGFDYSLQHEVGHYVEMYASTTGATQRGYSEDQFDRELQQVATLAFNNPKLNSYPKGYYNRNRGAYYAEFWAEAFNSFYCSEEANQNFSETFPEVYAFVSKYLEAPVWGSNGGQGYKPPTEIKIMLYSAKQTPNVLSAYVAGPKTMTGLTVCYENKENCDANSAGTVSVDLSTQQTSFANFYYIRDLGVTSANKHLYFRGLNQQNQVMLTRPMVLSHK